MAIDFSSEARCKSTNSRLLIFLLLFVLFSKIPALHPGRVFSLKFKHSEQSLYDLPHDEHRRILRGSATSRLHGHILTKGYYYTDIMLGSPGKVFSVILDTGSSMMYVPCSTCSKCGNHDDKPYSPQNSTTYQSVQCGSELCLNSGCGSNNQCSYSRYYQEGSASYGIVVSDLISLGSNSTVNLTRVSFGCETYESGQIYSQTTDGIMGLGRGQASIIKQLVDNKAIDDSFSLCFGGLSDGEGTMIFGSHPMPNGTVFAQTLPTRSAGFYNVQVLGITVDSVPLSIPLETFNYGFGTIFDSGTTFTYLPSPLFGKFYEAVFAGIKVDAIRIPPPDPHFPDDICFGAKNESVGKFLQLSDFPQVDFVFSPNAVYKLSPENYLFQHFKHVGAFCLGFFPNQSSGALLGAIMVRNTLINYDRQNNRIGLFKANCSSISTMLSL